MKKKNNTILFCLLLLILFFYSGCISYNEFAQRKYLKGNFYESAERPPVVHLKEEYRAGMSKSDKVDNATIEPVIASAPKTAISNTPFLHLKKGMFVPDHIILNSIPQGNQKIILHKKKPAVVLDKASENDTELNSRRALSFGIWGLVFTLLVITSFYLGLTFSIVALHKSSKVLKDTNATKEQIRRARTARVLGILSLVLFVLITVLVMLIIRGLSGLAAG